jgi:glycosyltransferase involved in cell wall biosynthesis
MVEGVPQVVVQALAAGVPVVATEVIGLSEVFQAPIVRVARTGLGLTGAIEEALSRPSAPVPLAALRPWHPASVEADYELFLRELEQTVCTDAASVYPSENVPARRGAVVG